MSPTWQSDAPAAGDTSRRTEQPPSKPHVVVFPAPVARLDPAREIADGVWWTGVAAAAPTPRRSPRPVTAVSALCDAEAARCEEPVVVALVERPTAEAMELKAAVVTTIPGLWIQAPREPQASAVDESAAILPSVASAAAAAAPLATDAPPKRPSFLARWLRLPGRLKRFGANGKRETDPSETQISESRTPAE